MTHEILHIIDAFKVNNHQGLKSVLVTVVDLNGSSYRKPGVRMLMSETGQMTGAVSGGCVEKEIFRQAKEVFETGLSLMMTYDGRYRLGCEGLLYILIEPFQPNKSFLDEFSKCLESRNSFEITSYYTHTLGLSPEIGSQFTFDNVHFQGNELVINHTLDTFQQTLPPIFKLLIIGTEHDAVQLCTLAAFTGWHVEIVSSGMEMKSVIEFPGAKTIHHLTPNEINDLVLDAQTAIVLMSHNFAKDLNYLTQLKASKVVYIGVLGSKKRMDQLFSALLDQPQEPIEEFMDKIHGPAGLNISAITPQEIAVSIVSQIIALTRENSTSTALISCESLNEQ
jgi:xanthine/CO dehydrogenase XdhC/CoxF family maturation factor